MTSNLLKVPDMRAAVFDPLTACCQRRGQEWDPIPDVPGRRQRRHISTSERLALRNYVMKHEDCGHMSSVNSVAACRRQCRLLVCTRNFVAYCRTTCLDQVDKQSRCSNHQL